MSINNSKTIIKYSCVVIILFIGFLVFKIHINKKLRIICNLPVISDQKLIEANKLLKLGADPNQTYASCNPLLLELMTSFKLYNDKNHNRLFILLLQHGANPNARNYWGESAPLLAAGFDPEVEKALLKYGSNPRDTLNGVSVLQILIDHNEIEDAKIVEQAIKETEVSNSNK
jgi:hypothetical protein